MGIAQLKEQLKHLQGINDLRMQYGRAPNGAETEIYIMGDVRMEFPPMTGDAEIANALANPFEYSKKKLQQSELAWQ